jgi:2-polyprenyl-6-methoxyphenol hydroxylase-like FAD-dependent oxidoreductase
MENGGVLIAGGGVGGLALALSLHERGITCTVFEAAAEVKPLGVGINTLPHAIAELAALGLLPALEQVAIRTRELRYLNRFGQEISREPRGVWAGHPAPQFSIHRGHLHQVLWDAARQRLGPGRVLAGRRIAAFEQDNAGVTLRFADGPATRGNTLVGADGIHSVVRAALHADDGGLRWQGIFMWRGAVDWPALETGDVMLIAGDMALKLVFYPIAPGTAPDRRLTNFVVCARLGDGSMPPPAREDWSREGRLEDVMPHVDRFRIPGLDVAALVRAAPKLWEYPMCDRDPLPWWSHGRVTLLGDAAHPMYAVGSNGASQAVLDARCLARHLALLQVPEALAAYEAERLPATAAIVHANRKGGPERVVDLVSQRAPDGFSRVEDVITPEEIAAIAGQYARMAGFAVAR